MPASHGSAEDDALVVTHTFNAPRSFGWNASFEKLDTLLAAA